MDVRTAPKGTENNRSSRLQNVELRDVRGRPAEGGGPLDSIGRSAEWQLLWEL